MKKYLILFLILLPIRIESQTIIPENNLDENAISLEWESPTYSLAGGVSSVNNVIDDYFVLKDDKYFGMWDNNTRQKILTLEMETNDFVWLPVGNIDNNGGEDYIFLVYQGNSLKVKFYDFETRQYFYKQEEFVPYLTLLGLTDYNNDKIYEPVLGQYLGPDNYYGLWDYINADWIWKISIGSSIPFPNAYNFFPSDLNNNGAKDIIVEYVDTLKTQSLAVREGSTGDLLLKKTSSTLDYVLFDLENVDSDSIVELLIYELDFYSGSYRMLIYSTDHFIPTPIIAENEQVQLDSYALFKNYPNPFNPSTTIDFQIPKREFVDIIIYNILGQEITRLKSEYLNPGTYSVDWQAKDKSGIPVSSGIYIYVLKTKQKFLSKRMTLIK